MPNLFHSSLHKYIPGITTKAQRSSISAAVDQSVMHIKYKVVLVAQWRPTDNIAPDAVRFQLCVLHILHSAFFPTVPLCLLETNDNIKYCR